MHTTSTTVSKHYWFIYDGSLKWFLFHRRSLLFDQIYPRISSVEVARDCFLQLLEPHVLNDRLQTISPSIMQQFVALYEDRGWLEALEGCISHVDVSSLDLHQILTLSHIQGLCHAYLYVHTRALHDYVNPGEDLMKPLQGYLSVWWHCFLLSECFYRIWCC